MFTTPKHSLNLKQQTEKALKTINEYEKVKKFEIIATTYKLKPESNMGILIREFQGKQKIRLQLLPNNLAYYQLFINASIDNKIIIRHFRGGPVQLYIFYNKLGKELDKASQRFIVKDQIILIMQKNTFTQAKSIILAFKNDRNLTILTFRIDTIQLKTKNRTIRTDRSIDSIKSIQLDEIYKSDEQKLARKKSSRKKISKINLEPFDLLQLRPEQRIKRIQQLKAIEFEKQLAAKKRIENIQVYKQKNVEALKVSVSCKRMFNTYQQLIEQEENKKHQILKNYTQLFYAIKFCKISSMLFQQTQKKRRRVFMIKNYEKKFVKKIRRAYLQTKNLQPDRSQRQLQSISQYACLFGYALNNFDSKRAEGVVKDVIVKCLPGVLINNAMGQASNYRRVIRTLQRRWKSKFHARTQILLQYAEEQLQIILKSYPQLSCVANEYRQNNRARALCLQYQKQTAAKMVDSIFAYRAKLQQIAEYQRINQEIMQFNKIALKKRQKQFLTIQKKPAFPSFRFFRDLQFFKSMIRGELEIQFRRFKRKNPQLINELSGTSPGKQKFKTNKKLK